MNNDELNNFRAKFHDNLEECFCDSNLIELKDYQRVFKETVKRTRVSEETSENIYVYIGSYIFDGKHTTLTYNNNPVLTYKMYRDIETGYMKKVFKNLTKDFEQTNKILFPEIISYSVESYDKEYDHLKYLYFKELLNKDQKSAYKLMKQLTPSK